MDVDGNTTVMDSIQVESTEPSHGSGSGIGGLDGSDSGDHPPAFSHQDTARAELAYKYPESIRQKEIKDIWVYAKVHTSPDAVKAELRSSIERYMQEVQVEDTIHIHTTEMGVYEYLTVTIEDPAGDFQLQPMHRHNRQKINLDAGNQWHWVMQTKSDKAKAILIIHAVSDNGDSTDFQWVNNKQIPIRIKLENEWYRRIYTWLMNNPEYVTGTLLVPFLVFVGRRFLKKKSE